MSRCANKFQIFEGVSRTRLLSVLCCAYDLVRYVSPVKLNWSLLQFKLAS